MRGGPSTLAINLKSYLPTNKDISAHLWWYGFTMAVLEKFSTPGKKSDKA